MAVIFQTRLRGADAKDGPDREGETLEEVAGRLHLLPKGRHPRPIRPRFRPLRRTLSFLLALWLKNYTILR